MLAGFFWCLDKDRWMGIGNMCCTWNYNEKVKIKHKSKIRVFFLEIKGGGMGKTWYEDNKYLQPLKAVVCKLFAADLQMTNVNFLEPFYYYCRIFSKKFHDKNKHLNLVEKRTNCPVGNLNVIWTYFLQYYNIFSQNFMVFFNFCSFSCLWG